MACGRCAIVALKIDRKIAKDAHRQLSDFPSNFRRHIEHQ
jgi:hypothetical protein